MCNEYPQSVDIVCYSSCILLSNWWPKWHMNGNLTPPTSGQCHKLLCKSTNMHTPMECYITCQTLFPSAIQTVFSVCCMELLLVSSVDGRTLCLEDLDFQIFSQLKAQLGSVVQAVKALAAARASAKKWTKKKVGSTDEGSEEE